MRLALDLNRQGAYCITKEIIVVSLTNSSQIKSLKQKRILLIHTEMFWSKRSKIFLHLKMVDVPCPWNLPSLNWPTYFSPFGKMKVPCPLLQLPAMQPTWTFYSLIGFSFLICSAEQFNINTIVRIIIISFITSI